MKEFFNVSTLDQVFSHIPSFSGVGIETIPLEETLGRVLAETIVSDVDLPDFARSTMDGYAVRASSTFGASEANPAYLAVKGAVSMGEAPDFSVGPGEAVRISTGGMLPPGADSVEMIEHTEAVDDTTIEVYRSVAPGQHMVAVGEDFAKEAVILKQGRSIRAAEAGLLAAFGKTEVTVYKKPVVGIVSTGDEVVPVAETPGRGRIRDINTHTLSGLVRAAGGIPETYGIVRDDYEALLETCNRAFAQTDMVLVSGGSSVGIRDFTIDVLTAIPDARILVHGISISPGKPTILAKAAGKPFWGLPGHVVSAMVVFTTVVEPFLAHISGRTPETRTVRIPARLSRNVSSAQGRVDYVRVRLVKKEGEVWAQPILGKSGLINTMVRADGLVEIDMNTEGLDKGATVEIIPLY